MFTCRGWTVWELLLKFGKWVQISPVKRDSIEWRGHYLRLTWTPIPYRDTAVVSQCLHIHIRKHRHSNSHAYRMLVHARCIYMHSNNGWNTSLRTPLTWAHLSLSKHTLKPKSNFKLELGHLPTNFSLPIGLQISQCRLLHNEHQPYSLNYV